MATNQTPKVTAEISIKNEKLTQGLKQSQQQFKNFGNDIKAQSTSIGSSFSGLSKGISGIGAALGVAVAAITGVAYAVQSAIKSTQDWREQTLKTGRQLGMSARDAMAYRDACEDVEMAEEEIVGTGTAFNKALFSKQDAFKQLGVELKDANGNFRSHTAILDDTLNSIRKIQNPVERNIALMSVFGKQADGASKLLELQTGAVDRAADANDRLGKILDKETNEKLKKYNQMQRDSQDVTEAYSISVSRVLMPELTKLGNWLNNTGTDGVGRFEKGLRYLVGGVYVVIAAFKVLWETVKYGVTAIIEDSKAAWNMTKAIARGDVEGANRVQYARAAARAKENADIQLKYLEIAQWLQAETLRIHDESSTPIEQTTDNGNKLGQTDAELKAREQKIKEAKAREYEIAEHAYKLETQAYKDNVEVKAGIAIKHLEKIKAIYGEDSKEYRKQAEEVAKIKAELVAREQKIDAVNRKHAHEIALQDIDFQLSSLKDRYSSGYITQREFLELEKELLQERYDLQIEFLEKELGIELAKSDGLSERGNELLNQIEMLRNEKTNSANTSDNQISIAGQDPVSTALQEYQTNLMQLEASGASVVSVIDGIGASIGNTFNGLISGQIKLGNVFKSVWGGIRNVVASAVSDMIANQIKLWLVEKARAAWNTISTKKEIGENTTKQSSNIFTAISGFFKAYAPYPWVGVAMAVASIAVMMAMMKKATARATGGLITKPEWGVRGEAGPELVAPESNFKDYMRGFVSSVQSDIAARNEAATANIRLASAGIANQVLAGATGGNASNPVQVTLTGNTFIGTSQDSMDSASKVIVDMIRYNEKYYG